MLSIKFQVFRQVRSDRIQSDRFNPWENFRDLIFWRDSPAVKIEVNAKLRTNIITQSCKNQDIIFPNARLKNTS